MAFGFRKRASEAVPKVFQTFNSLLGSIVRKKNATIVGPSKQLVGEFPPVTFERLFEFYHHWDQIKRSMDTSHQKLIGAGIEIKSNNEYFNIFIEKWWKTTNAGKKFSEFFLSGLITGNAIMEIQYTSDGRIGNIEHIPMQTIFRVFRDQFANELKLVQVVDGVFKELDPEYFMHWMINNPDRQAFGKSEFFSVASPRPVTTKVDKFTGQPINPDRNLRPLLDAQAILQNAEVEIKEKMAKPRLIVSAPGMPQDQMKQVQLEMADANSDQYIWIFDKPVDSKELQIQAQTKFDDYGNNVDSHIDIATGFASKVISHPGGFSYSSAQSPLDVLDQRMVDMQNDGTELIIDKLLRPLAESWGFKEFDEMETEVSFTPNVKRLTMEDIKELDPESVAPKEKREMYKKLNIPLDDQLYDEFQNEIKQDKQDQKDTALVQAQNSGFGAGGTPQTGGKGQPPSGGESPTGKSDVKPIKPLEATPIKPDSEKDRPEPTRTDKQEPSPFRKKKGEALTEEDVEKIVLKAVEATMKAHERIPLPPKAGALNNDSVDLYVSQGLDTPGRPDVTDPAIRKVYGLDKDEFEGELPPNAPQRRADAMNPPVLDPSEQARRNVLNAKRGDSVGIDFTNAGGQGIPQVDAFGKPINQPPQVKLNDYVNELEGKVKGDHTKGGTGDQRINQDSTGDFKDPHDFAGKQNELPEPETQQPQTTNIGPRTRDELGRKLTGGYSPEEPDLKQLGSPNNDEPPYEKSEGFGKDIEDEQSGKLKKLENSQQLKKAQELNIDPLEKRHKDARPPEESDPKLPFEDPNPHLNEPQKGQVQLDDTPLQEEPVNDPNGINPSRPQKEGQSTNQATNLDDIKNDIVDDGNAVKPAIGQSDQERLRQAELTGNDDHSTLPTLGDPPIDQSGLNVRPDETNVLQDITKQDPIGNVRHDDGMIVKPEDVQQVQPPQQQPIDPQKGGMDVPAPGADPNVGQNIDQGVDPNEIDPNQLHIDPETGINYTDLTDEQGNEVPDLRFDQTPNSDEKQPDVELENEIVTKEEYEAELEGQRHQNEPMAQPPMVSEDEFNAELNKNPEPNVIDNTIPDEPQGRVEKLFNPEEPKEEGWEPMLAEDDDKKVSEALTSDGMRVQSEQVFVNPAKKVIGAPKFQDRRKKKAQEEFKEQEHPRGKGGKFAKKGTTKGAKVDDSRQVERTSAIKDITNTFPNRFDYETATKQSIKAEKIQDKHQKRVKEVINNLKEKFPNTDVTGRVKTTYSMLEKLARKPDLYKDVSDLQDVSGIRSLCKDLNEVNNVVDYVKENYDVISEENYIKEPNGGYRSIHLEVIDKQGTSSEIQIRTPNQQKWADWAHDNFYKPLTNELKEYLAENMNAITEYSYKMSDYFYDLDSGKKTNPPECPPELVVIGCIQ